MQVLNDPRVHELTLELRLRPRWLASILIAALYLAFPPVGGTGEDWGRTGPDGGANYHPNPSAVVEQLLVTGNVTEQGPGTATGEIGWPPSVILGRGGVGTDAANPQVVALAPSGGNFVGIGVPSGSNPQTLLHVKGHMRVAQCIWIRSSQRCAGDWE